MSFFYWGPLLPRILQDGTLLVRMIDLPLPLPLLQILETQDKVAEKTEILVPFNILPLDPDSANQAIMRFPEA